MSEPSRPPLPVGLARVRSLLAQGAHRAKLRVNLVPSEAQLSPLARAPLSSDFYFRYFFNEHADPTFWEFRGAQEVGHLEHDLTIPALRRLSGATHVNIRPISGLNAMLLVVCALAPPNGRVVCVSRSTGGHFATSSLISRLGRRAVPVDVANGRMDVDQLSDVLAGEDVALVYVDLQNTLVEVDVAPVADVIRRVSPKTHLHIDSSHTLGLVLGGAHGNPLVDGAHSFGGSTHKTFPGPQKGVVFTNASAVAEKLRMAQFDLISSHHFAETLALGLAAAEFEVFGESYAERVVRNAQVFARALKDQGFEVAGNEPDLTQTHQVWTRHGDTAAVTAMGDRLLRAGIAANVQTDLPGQSGPAFRLGVNEVTFLGAGPDAMHLLAEAFVQARAGSVRVAAEAVRATFGEPFHFPAGAQDGA